MATLIETASIAVQESVAKHTSLVNFDALEAASYNWAVPALGVVGESKGVGCMLFRRAGLQLVADGYSGRVGLGDPPNDGPTAEHGSE